MQRRVCCYRWLVQARSPEFHRGKVNSFSWDVVRGGGGCLGFQRGAVWFEFRALTAWGKKLLSSLAERALILRYRLPGGRSWKRLWEGWVGSSTILFALLEHRVRKISRMEGRGAGIVVRCMWSRALPSALVKSIWENYRCTLYRGGDI